MTHSKTSNPTTKQKLSKSERRQIENEMIFRRSNEKAGDSMDKLDELHIQENAPELLHDAESLVSFLCECSDEDCSEVIFITLTSYQEIHANRDTFIVRHEHQVDPIEKVIQKNADYTVVKKNNSTPEPGKKLNQTAIDNG